MHGKRRSQHYNDPNQHIVSIWTSEDWSAPLWPELWSLTCAGQTQEGGEGEPDDGDQGYGDSGAYKGGAHLSPGRGVG